ncbi:MULTISPECIES: hypothetical protein [Crenobacter]|uniref:Uncharacterized protein n=2 Tax=Crenobacter TaxID=1654931 RepID=A0A4V4N8P4_9NEIS|nr:MULTISPECIES: hypothetical protein [Crenobacter]NDV13020.1 hypothetical protein [Crenobacter caeni]TIC85203.1 hypothetical protein E5K04_04180 [Crenobacter intestini]
MSRSMYLFERDRIHAVHAIRNRTVGGPNRPNPQDKLRNDARREIESRRWDIEMGLRPQRD